MKISLITATYNSAETLQDALQSVASQKYPHIEHIIIDGDSKDQTIEILERESHRLHNFRYVSEPDEGIYDALNKGVSMAKGDIIGFLHSDDILGGPETLSRIASIFGETPVDGIYGDLVYVARQDPAKVIRYWESKPMQSGLMEKGWMPAHPTLYLRKEVYAKHGYFDITYRIAADYEFMLRVLKDPTYTLAYIPEILTRMKIGGASNRSIKNLLRKSFEDYRAMKKHGIPLPMLALIKKNFSKIGQFFSRPPSFNPKNS